MSITSSIQGAAAAPTLEGISRPLGIILTMEQAMALGGGFKSLFPDVDKRNGKGGAEKKASEVKSKEKNTWKSFSDSQLARAVELMVSPSDLSIRQVAQALLETLDYTPVEVKEHLESQSYLNDGFVFDAINSNEPAIIRRGSQFNSYGRRHCYGAEKPFAPVPRKAKKAKGQISENKALRYLVDHSSNGVSKFRRFLCNRAFLAKEWNVGVNTVRTTLKKLELNGNISLKTTNKGTIVTILRRSL